MRTDRLVDLSESYRRRLSGNRLRAGEVVDLVFQNPVITTTRITDALGTSLQGALNLVRRLEADGFVSEVAGIPGRSKRWTSIRVLRAIDPEETPIFAA